MEPCSFFPDFRRTYSPSSMFRMFVSVLDGDVKCSLGVDGFTWRSLSYVSRRYPQVALLELNSSFTK